MYHPWEIARFREAIGRGVRDVFEERPFTSARAEPAGDNAAAEIVESSEARDLIGPAAVFGTPEDPSCLDGVASYTLGCPAKLLYRVSQGRVIGNTSIIDGDGRLYWPDLVVTQTDLRHAIAHNANNSQACVLRDDGATATAFFYWGGAPRRIEGTGFFLPNPEEGNYGSFLFRIMPHLLQAARLGLTFDFFIAADRSHWLLDAIRLVGLPPKPILLAQEIFGGVVNDLVFFNDFCVEGFVPTSTAADFRALLGRLRPTVRAADGPAHLYVSRSLSRLRTPRYRQLRNELEIEHQARRRGCAVVYPEVLPFAGQISVFGRAQRVFGPSGSGMLNTMFGAEGTRVLDLESFHVTVRQHAKIYASTGKTYGFAFGTFDPADRRDNITRNWSMAPQVMEAGLDWLFAT